MTGIIHAVVTTLEAKVRGIHPKPCNPGPRHKDKKVWEHAY